MAKISIEVGHGGADGGAVTADKKVFEKNINLVVALELKRQLERHGQTVLISRTTDCNDRAADFFARSKTWGTDSHISVHVNAFNGAVKGFEVFKNTNEYKTQSDKLCSAIESEVKALGQTSRGIKSNPEASYVKYMNTMACPCAYCELGFMDNPADYKQFDTVLKQQAFGAAYAKGVLKYLGFVWKNETVASASGFKVGDKVKITAPYAASAFAKAASYNKAVGETRYIVRAFTDKAAIFPYQLGVLAGDTGSGNTTGFAKGEGIVKV